MIIDMNEIITKEDEAIQNTIIFQYSLKCGDDIKKARSILKNHKRFFAVQFQGEWIFAPTRFVGFRNNSVQDHEKTVREGNRNGTQVDRIISKLAEEINENSPNPYINLDDSFKDFCHANETEPSKHSTRRRYWVLMDDERRLPVDKSTSWEDHSKKLAKTILKTVRASGKSETRVTKLKSTDMTRLELSVLIFQKMKEQEFTCKLTGLKLERTGDPNFYPSPDRIDCQLGYFRDNIQVVCQFANKWKSDQTNEKFLMLIKAIKNT